MNNRAALALFLLIVCSQSATTHLRPAATGVQGALTVTAVVNSSVTLIEAPDGTQQLIVANAPELTDSFSYRPPSRLDKSLPLRAEETDNYAAKNAVSSAQPPLGKARKANTR